MNFSHFFQYRRGIGIVLLNKKGKIWVGQRSDGTKAWQMPQGGIDASESKITALWREMREETGTTNAHLRLALPFDISYTFPRGVSAFSKKGQVLSWFILDYLGCDEDFHVGREFMRWTWQDKNDVVDSIVSWKRSMYRFVLHFI